MLASLLPGLRDLRTPLATGYLWLIGLWLLMHQHVPKNVHEATGPIQSVYQLGALAGTTACLAAVSFVAYVMGSILSFNLRRNDLVFVRSTEVDGFVNERFMPFSLINRIITPAVGARLYSQLATFTSAALREQSSFLDPEVHAEVLPSSVMPGDHDAAPDELGRAVTRRYVAAIIQDLAAVAIQLQAKNRDFWDTYDRQTSEAQFRLGIAPHVLDHHSSGRAIAPIFLATPLGRTDDPANYGHSPIRFR
jgi:hypothetical protein